MSRKGGAESHRQLAVLMRKPDRDGESAVATLRELIAEQVFAIGAIDPP